MEKATRERLTGAVILVAALAILVPEMLSGPGEDARPGDAADALADTGPPLTTYELSLGAGASPAALAPEPVGETTVAEVPPVPPPVLPPAATPAPGPATAATGSSGASASPGPSPATTAAPPAAAPPARAAATPSAAPPARAATTPPAAPRTAPAAATPPPARATAAPAAATGGWWVQLGSFSSEQNARGLASRLRGKGFAIEVSQVRSGGRDLFRVRAGPEKDRAAATALRSRLAAAGEQGTLVAP